MEYEIEALITDLDLPRHIIQEDVEKGRLRAYQHNGDDKYYIDAEDFLDYISARVVELSREDQKAFWLAVKKIMMSPNSPRKMPPDEIAIVMTAIQREIDKVS